MSSITESGYQTCAREVLKREDDVLGPEVKQMTSSSNSNSDKRTGRGAHDTELQKAAGERYQEHGRIWNLISGTRGRFRLPLGASHHCVKVATYPELAMR